jgi:hypothetical protein
MKAVKGHRCALDVDRGLSIPSGGMHRRRILIYVTIVIIGDCRILLRNLTLGFCIRRIKDAELNARMVEGEICHTFSKLDAKFLKMLMFWQASFLFLWLVAIHTCKFINVCQQQYFMIIFTQFF